MTPAKRIADLLLAFFLTALLLPAALSLDVAGPIARQVMEAARAINAAGGLSRPPLDEPDVDGRTARFGVMPTPWQRRWHHVGSGLALAAAVLALVVAGVLVGRAVGIVDLFLDVLDRDQAFQVAIVVDQRQLFTGRGRLETF